MSKPLRILITGAAGQIGYALIPHMLNGSVFGKDQPVELHLLDIKQGEKLLTAAVMEIQDCTYPLLKGLLATTDVKEAFTGVDVAVLVGGFPRLKGMERKDLMNKNSSIFIEQGRALRLYSNPNVKVLVVANPANSNCLVAMHHACFNTADTTATDPKPLSPDNFTCLTRLDMNRACYQLGERFGVAAGTVKNVIIWGNHSSTLFPDLEHATVVTTKSTGAILSTPIASHNDAKDKLTKSWIQTDAKGFAKTVQQRGAAVLDARGLSSAMSAAHAIGDHLRDWLFGTAPGEFVSMGVYSDSTHYGIARDLIYSFPVTCQKGGKYTIVPNLPRSQYAIDMCKITEAELLDERKLLVKSPATHSSTN